MGFEKKSATSIAQSYNCIIFASIVPVLLPACSVNGSFSSKVIVTNNNTPPMPLLDAHLGGLFFL